MAVSSVSTAAGCFLREQVGSVRELEMLMALRAAGARPTRPAQLSAQLRADVAWTEQQLARMAQEGLVSAARDDAGRAEYRYAPATPGLVAVLEEVAHLLRTRRTTVIRLIYADPDPADDRDPDDRR